MKPNYKITQDIMYTHFIQNKPNLSKATKKQYQTVLTKFTKSTQTTLTEIIQNCKKQQETIIEKTTHQKTDKNGNTIIEKTITQFDVNNPTSQINQYLNQHIQYCKQKNNTNYTINHDLGFIQTFLRYYHITLPDREKHLRKTPEWYLLTKEDFQYIINDSTLTHKSLIKHLMSSGMRLSDALNLSIGDFMKATQEYHTFIDINEFIDNAPQNMIATWDFIPQKTEKFKIRCITFSDPETTNLILQNLRRIKNEALPKLNKKTGENLTLSKHDALFASKKQKYKGYLSQHSVSDIFYKKNKKLKKHHTNLIKEKIKNGELSIEDYEEELQKIPKFHAHGCRKYFITTISKNCGDLRICTLMEGHTSPVDTDASYVKYDVKDVKEAYMAAMPDLSLENTETKVYTSDVRREMEEKINKLEQELSEKDRMIQDKYDNILKRIGILESKSDEEILAKYRKK